MTRPFQPHGGRPREIAAAQAVTVARIEGFSETVGHDAGRRRLARGSGAIINIASLAAHRGMPLSSPYTVSKHGVLGLTRALASEWATSGVRVNAISPGFFMTDLNRDKMRQDRKEAALRRTPAWRFGDLEELVGAAVFLASPAALFINGQTIAVDGGFLAAGLDGPELTG